MKITTKSLLTGIVLLAFVAVLGIAGCANDGENKESNTPDQQESTQVSVDGEFVSDEQCLSCHGGTYEALAETTASQGDWNPHDSIHGGYNSCINCHERDRELTDNQCAHCHAYTPEGLMR